MLSTKQWLWFALLFILALFHVGFMISFFFAILIWRPRTRIVELFNIIRRQPSFSRDGKPPPNAWNYPSLGQHGFLHVNGIKLHYVASGAEDKPLMLFLHGYLGCWYTWRHQIRAFNKNYRVVALDMRGYSLSDCPVGNSNYTLGKHVADINAVIEALGYKKSILVGFEFGAILAMKTASLYPDKISKIIVFNQPASGAYMDHIFQQLSDIYFISPWMMAQIPYFCEFMLTFDDLKHFEAIFHTGMKGKISEEDLEVYKYAFSQKGVIYSALENYRCMHRADNFKSKEVSDMDILLIYGTKDNYLSQNIVDDNVKYYPKGIVKSIEGGTHFVLEDQSEDVNKIIYGYLN